MGRSPEGNGVNRGLGSGGRAPRSVMSFLLEWEAMGGGRGANVEELVATPINTSNRNTTTTTTTTSNRTKKTKHSTCIRYFRPAKYQQPPPLPPPSVARYPTLCLATITTTVHNQYIHSMITNIMELTRSTTLAPPPESRRTQPYIPCRVILREGQLVAGPQHPARLTVPPQQRQTVPFSMGKPTGWAGAGEAEERGGGAAVVY